MIASSRLIYSDHDEVEEGERGNLRNMMRMILKTVNVILSNAFFINSDPFACELNLEVIFPEIWA